MKCSKFKLLTILTLINCSFLNAFSQETSSFFKEGLWIKSKSSDTITNGEENRENNYLNFNEFIDFSKNKSSKRFKNLVSKSSSLFIVFKSISEEEISILSLKFGSSKTLISNQNITSDKLVTFNKGNAKTGMILSYQFNKNSKIDRKKGHLIFEDLLFDNSQKSNQIAELIYIPRYVSNKEKEIIESYLSLKFGISLNKDQNYYDSAGKKIWDIKQNDGFNFNITGIGNDKYTGLNQKQSKNSLEDGLSIGLNKIMLKNSENESIIKDHEFLLWGNNGESVILEKNSLGNQKKIKRVWKLNPLSDSTRTFVTQIKIDKKFMQIDPMPNLNDKEFIWLAIDSLSTSVFNYDNAKYIKAAINNENEIVFDNIKFNTGSNYLFTMVKAMESEINSNSIPLNEAQKQNDIGNISSGQFLIYPNPISANEKFSIKFNFNTFSNVLVQITDINGKVIKTKNLGSIKNYHFSESLSVSGTYLILISINGEIETSRLIVK